MKIAVFMYIDNHLGGAERRFIRIFSHLSSDELQPEILIQESKAKKAKDLISPFVTERVSVKIFSGMCQLILYVIRSEIKWIAGFTPGGRFILLSLIALICNIKRLFLCVETSNSDLRFGKGFSQRLRKLKFFSCMRLASVIDCLYPSSFQRLQQQFPSKRIKVTANSFTDLETFTPSGNKHNVIVFASTLIPIKNVDLFVEAVNIVQKKIRELGYRCIICGDGPLLQHLQEAIADRNCCDIIELTGRVKMETILPYSKIFCSLQSINNYPSQSLIEAIACGCYCIATNCGDTSLLVKPEFGTLVEFDPQSIADALLHAMQFKKEDWEIVKSEARIYAEKHCRIETSVDYYTEIFSS